MSSSSIIAFACALAAAAPARADAVLERLLDEAAAASPEVAEARAHILAERARAPQAEALPDPVLSVGVQNDGFTRIAIGSTETSWVSLMITQSFPWPGKRGLREQVALVDARAAHARLQRAVLQLDARVRRAWLDVRSTRAQLELLGELQSLWSQAAQIARTRYEAGRVPQTDLLRAQLESMRLDQRRQALEAELRLRAAGLNRLRARPLDEPLPAAAPFSAEPDPAVATLEVALADAEARSPELLLARLGVEQSGRRVELARKERYPDFAISAGVMPRGLMEPMWQVGVSVGLPLWSGRKQGQAVVESQHRAAAQGRSAEAIRQVLRLRVHERLVQLRNAVQTNQRYREGLLVLSEAATRSALAQYQAGQLTFAAVLEALGGHLSDRAAWLSSIADAQRIAIAEREVSLDPVVAGSVDAMASGTPFGSSAAPSAARTSTPAPSGAAPSTSSQMSGM